MAGVKGRSGRPKGVPNKMTHDARLAFQKVYEGRLRDLNRWLTETAEGFECVHFLHDGTAIKYLKRDPARAAELLLRMAEHFVPKLTRSEVTGAGGGPVIVERVVHEVKE